MLAIEAQFRIDWPGFTLDVDLALPARGVTALFGHSGSGKTTLLRCIAGLERAPRGRLCVAGDVWQDARHWLPAHRRPLGYVFQEASLFPHLTVLGNLRYGLQRSAAVDRTRLEQAIELLAIAPLLERKPDRLSGGERQRVAIARALAVSPRLLLMDEPLAALDAHHKQEILPYLERLYQEWDIPILYVSHATDEIVRLADHLIVLAGGRVVAQGPLPETFARLDPPLRLADDVGAVLEARVAELDRHWHLALVDFAGGRLWTRDDGRQIGQRVRLRVLARDISLAREAPSRSSIQNILRGRVDAVIDDEHPGLALVRVRVGESALLARLTRRAASTLEISIGDEVWVQIKSVALLG